MMCPVCGSKNIGVSSVNYTSTKFKFLYEREWTCIDCDWVGYWKDLISDEEYKNIERTKLIDEMLNE